MRGRAPPARGVSPAPRSGLGAAPELSCLQGRPPHEGGPAPLPAGDAGRSPRASVPHGRRALRRRSQSHRLAGPACPAARRLGAQAGAAGGALTQGSGDGADDGGETASRKNLRGCGTCDISPGPLGTARGPGWRPGCWVTAAGRWGRPRRGPCCWLQPSSPTTMVTVVAPAAALALSSPCSHRRSACRRARAVGLAEARTVCRGRHPAAAGGMRAIVLFPQKASGRRLPFTHRACAVSRERVRPSLTRREGPEPRGCDRAAEESGPRCTRVSSGDLTAPVGGGGRRQ